MMDRVLVVAAALLLVGTASHAQPNKEQYELQERCGRRAAEFFDRVKKELQSMEGPLRWFHSTYQNHYNSRLNKCFILEDTIITADNDPSLDHSFSITDINENKKYGVYWGRNHVCWVSGKTKDCWPHTEEEWRELIKPFMED